MVYFWIGFGFCIIPFLLVVYGVVNLIYNFFKYKIIEKSIKTTETTGLPSYSPAVMGYLINKQKLTKREALSTLFDLINRKIIKIKLKKGLVSDDVGNYSLELNMTEGEELTEYENILIDYLFDNKKNKIITQENLKNKFYKNNFKSNYSYYKNFYNSIQEHAKKEGFFDRKTGGRKVKTYNLITKISKIISIVTTIAIAPPGVVLSALYLIFGDFSETIMEILVELAIDFAPMRHIMFSIFVFPLIITALVWTFNFIIIYLYNLTCFYNKFSEKGKKEYQKCIGLKKFLENNTTLGEHPIMGIEIWGKYYVYAIGLNCSKKFFEQMKKMNVAEGAIDSYLLEVFNDLKENFEDSLFLDMKTISVDEYGGCHVNY